MKKMFIIMGMGIILFANSAHNESLIINGAKSFNIVLKPNTIKTNIQIKIKNKQISTIMNNISKVANTTKKYCNNMDYSFYPTYQYKKGKQIFDGYKANINLICKFNKKEKNMLSTIINKISKYGNIRLLNIKLIDKNKNASINQTRMIAYQYITKEAKKLSANLKKVCIPTKISFNDNQHHIIPMPLYKRNSLMIESSTAINRSSLPIPKKDYKETLKVNYSITCY